MTKKLNIQLFDSHQVRAVWDDDREEWYFSVIDAIAVLMESNDYQTSRKYWNKLKERIKKEASELVTICHQLKLPAADGKLRLTDVATPQQLFRIIQAVPSRRAEPFKQWMSAVAAQRIEQMQAPELSIEQAILDYRRLGYSEAWINQRIRSIEVRKELTDEWQRTGVKEGIEYATLTDIITQSWSGMSTKQYKRYKGLKKESLRDHMTNLEMAFNTLAEASTTALSRQRSPHGFEEQKSIAQDGGHVAKVARTQLEEQLGTTIISESKALTNPLPTAPSSKED